MIVTTTGCQAGAAGLDELGDDQRGIHGREAGERHCGATGQADADALAAERETDPDQRA